VITCDTSGLLALLNRIDPAHRAVTEVVDEEIGELIIPAAVLGELAYMLERLRLRSIVDVFLSDLAQQTFVVDWTVSDMPRIRELISRYADFPLGIVDASVIACAERHGGRVLTLDRRHFGVVAREGTITVLPVSA
jgi:uncharacterized protein